MSKKKTELQKSLCNSCLQKVDKGSMYIMIYGKMFHMKDICLENGFNRLKKQDIQYLFKRKEEEPVDMLGEDGSGI